MLRVGLTGGIGSGKSTVAALLARHGVPVIDTDDIARELSAPGQPAHDDIVRVFGHDILSSRGVIDRGRLRTEAFATPDRRKQLEALLHPRIRKEVHARLHTLNAAYCVVVVPLLIETDFSDLVDRVLVIDADEAERRARVQTRSGIGAHEVEQIMAAQASRHERLAHADDVIVNNAGRAHLEREVTRLHHYYLALAATSSKV